MTISAKTYYDKLHSYLANHYIVDHGLGDSIKLTEPIQVGATLTKKVITLPFNGHAFAINLDQKSKGKGDDPALYHFLDNSGKPWSKRCDFVIFQYVANSVRVYLIEFKSKSINGHDISNQIKSSFLWCKAMHATLKIYTGFSKKIKVAKYIFSLNDNPNVFLCDDNLYLSSDHSIRHYHYDDITGLNLDDLDRNQEEFIS